MIDISTQTLVSLAEAAQHLPGQPHVTTVFRWAARGVRGVRLETCLVGGRRFTSRQALQAFAEATTNASRSCAEARD